MRASPIVAKRFHRIGAKQPTLLTYAVLGLIAIVLTACATGPDAVAPLRPFNERADTQVIGGFTVTAAALGAAESREEFGADLNAVGVQPVWLRISNSGPLPQWIFPVGIDEDYFAPYEAARRAAVLANLPTDQLYKTLKAKHVPQFAQPRGTVEGFVFAHSDEGMKAFTVQLHGPKSSIDFHFVAPVPGLPTDYIDLTRDAVRLRAEYDLKTIDELRQWLEALPCCPSNTGGRQGAPLNVAFVGALKDVRGAMISSGWDVTAPVTGASLSRMASAFIFGSRYRYAPISPLYLFDRDHDLAFQRARAIVDERNHMRLWLSPATFEGSPIWIGQISRDVGVKLSGRLWPPTTHIIDLDLDSARFYLVQQMLVGERIDRLGYVQGQQPATLEAPYRNEEDDPYFTDGLRAVFFMADSSVRPSDIDLLGWRRPPAMEAVVKRVFDSASPGK